MRGLRLSKICQPARASVDELAYYIASAPHQVCALGVMETAHTYEVACQRPIEHASNSHYSGIGIAKPCRTPTRAPVLAPDRFNPQDRGFAMSNGVCSLHRTTPVSHSDACFIEQTCIYLKRDIGRASGFHKVKFSPGACNMPVLYSGSLEACMKYTMRMCADVISTCDTRRRRECITPWHTCGAPCRTDASPSVMSDRQSRRAGAGPG